MQGIITRLRIITRRRSRFVTAISCPNHMLLRCCCCDCSKRFRFDCPRLGQMGIYLTLTPTPTPSPSLTATLTRSEELEAGNGASRERAQGNNCVLCISLSLCVCVCSFAQVIIKASTNHNFYLQLSTL